MTEYNITELTTNGQKVRIFNPIYTEEQEAARNRRIENALQRIGKEMVSAGII